jgi:hypothetical protein
MESYEFLNNINKFKRSGTEFEGTYCLIKTQTLIRFLLIKGSDAWPGARKLRGLFINLIKLINMNRKL